MSGTVIHFLPDNTTYLYTHMAAQANVPAKVMNPNDKLVPFATKMTQMMSQGDYAWFCEQAFTEAEDLAKIVVELNTDNADPNLEWFCLYAQDQFNSAVRLAEVLKLGDVVASSQARVRQTLEDARAFVDTLTTASAKAGHKRKSSADADTPDTAKKTKSGTEDSD